MGRTEIILHAQVNSQRASYEPAATAFCQIRRLRNLRYAKNAFIKGSRFGLSAGWHCQLHVIDLSNAHENPTRIDFRLRSFGFKLAHYLPFALKANRMWRTGNNAPSAVPGGCAGGSGEHRLGKKFAQAPP
jgi:hypothetical protein